MTKLNLELDDDGIRKRTDREKIDRRFFRLRVGKWIVAFLLGVVVADLTVDHLKMWWSGNELAMVGFPVEIGMGILFIGLAVLIDNIHFIASILKDRE